MRSLLLAHSLSSPLQLVESTKRLYEDIKDLRKLSKQRSRIELHILLIEHTPLLKELALGAKPSLEHRLTVTPPDSEDESVVEIESMDEKRGIFPRQKITKDVRDEVGAKDDDSGYEEGDDLSHRQIDESSGYGSEDESDESDYVPLPKRRRNN